MTDRTRSARARRLAPFFALLLAALLGDARSSAAGEAVSAAPVPTIGEAARLAIAEIAAPGGALDLARQSDEGTATETEADEPDEIDGEGGEESQIRSPVKAFFLSMILPGLGQRYYGNRSKALACYIGEAGLWTSFVVFKIQGDKREEDFEEWAKTFAGAKLDGHDRDDEYFQRVSRYLSSDDYNLEVKVVARLIYPNDRDAQLAFIADNSIVGDDTWSWASNDTRNQFRVIRHRALDSDRHANWTLGGLVLLRLVSGIDAALGTSAANKRLVGGDLSLLAEFPSGEPGLALGYSRGF